MKREFKVEPAIYLVIFFLALFLRLVLIDVNPLNDSEAALALRAFDLSRGAGNLIGSQPVYTLLTAGIFYLTTSDEFTARVIPALFGASLVLVAYLGRRFLGWLPALLLSFLIAFNPSLVAVSRQAGGMPVAIFAMLMAVIFFQRNQLRHAGIFSAIAILSGEQIWTGILTLILTWIWYRWSVRDNSEPPADDAGIKRNWRDFGAFFAGTFVIVGTGIFLLPQGITGIGDSLVAYINSWTTGSWSGLVERLRIILFYEPLLVIFTIIGLLWRPSPTGKIDHWTKRWFAIAFVLFFIKPGGRLDEIIWLLLPMMVVSARTIALMIAASHENFRGIISHATMVLVLLFFGWLNLAAIQHANDQQVLTIRTIGMAGAIVLILLISILVMWGWSLRVALHGLMVGMTAGLVVFTLASAIHAGGIGRNPSAEMWHPEGYFLDADLVKSTLGDISERSIGTRDGADILVAGIDTPGLRWLLRDFRNVTFVSDPAVRGESAMIITPDGVDLNLPVEYRGQDFILAQRPAWQLFLPSDWLKWLLSREAMMDNTYFRAWARLDLFPGNLALPE